jgi:hypothetical protein
MWTTHLLKWARKRIRASYAAGFPAGLDPLQEKAVGVHAINLEKESL